MSLDWKYINFGSKFLEKLFLCINAKCISSFFSIIITLTLIIVGANENALQKISCYPFIHCYPFIQF